MASSRYDVRLTVAAVLVLLLAGCSAPTLEGGTGGNGGSGGTGGQPGSPQGDTGAGSGTDSGADSGTESTGGRLPAGWPDEVVVPDGEIVQGVSMGGSGWLALIEVADPAAEFATSAASLQAAGYTVVSEVVADHGSVGIYENAELQVQVSVTDAPESGWNMSYTITKKG